MPNVAVTYQIEKVTDLLGNEAQGDGQLGSSMVYTDEYGLVANVFNGGTVGDRIYTISLSTDCAQTMTIQVVVTETPCGCINVKLDYEGPLDPSSLNTIKVHVLPSAYTCDLLDSTNEGPPNSLGDKTITDLYGTTKFECIPAGSYYTVFATARGPKFAGQEKACVVASACDDGVFVQPDKCRNVTLLFNTATLNPTGCYDSTDVFDLSKVIEDCAGGDVTFMDCATNTGQVGQQICCVIDQIETFFNNPGVIFVDAIVVVAEQFLPTIIVDAVANIFHDAVAKIITDLLFNNAPTFIKDFFTIGQDMVGIVTRPELKSKLCLSKLQSNYSIQGTHYYTGIVLYWKIGCDPAAPDYATCGQYVFDMEDLQNTQFPLSLVEGKFIATIADFNRLIVDQHSIDLNYGKLALFVLNELLIPSITGGQAHSVLEAAKLWVDCKAVADGVIGEVIGLIPGLTKGDVEDVCNQALDVLLQPVDLFLGSLTLDSNISLQGSGTMVDDTCDLKVDRIINGQWYGHIQTSESAQSAVTGTWEAVKQ
ncbi:MAG: hypothetical protein GXP54_04645 [Deltaproteobacteria bacterium]|nr:hypothetical protein [Deltaproteobacteria bacterium]